MPTCARVRVSALAQGEGDSAGVAKRFQKDHADTDLEPGIRRHVLLLEHVDVDAVKVLLVLLDPRVVRVRRHADEPALLLEVLRDDAKHRG